MKRILILTLLTLALASGSGYAQSTMIPLTQIEDMFASMKANGVNTDTKMLYGYFFTHTEPNKLQTVADELKGLKFEYVDIYQDEEQTYWLHMERIETHTAQSLFELNKQLYGIAAKHNVSSYDGFDVGNPDKTKPIERNTYAVPEEFQANDFFRKGSPFIVITNTAFDNFLHKEEFSAFLTITVGYELDNSSKLPNKTDYQELDEFEAFIENNLTQNSIANYYIGRSTWAGKRTMYFVSNDKENVKGLMDFLKAQDGLRHFDFEVKEDKKWKSYSDLKKLLTTK